MFCNHCGNKINDTMKFCSRCATPIGNPANNSDVQIDQEISGGTSQQFPHIGDYKPPVKQPQQFNSKPVIIISSLVLFLFVNGIWFAYGTPFAVLEFIQNKFQQSMQSNFSKNNSNSYSTASKPVETAKPKQVIKETNKVLDDRINQIISSNTSNTDYGIYAKNLKTGYTYSLNEKREFPSSALSYVSILYAMANYANTHRVNLDSAGMNFFYESNGREKPDSRYDNGNYFSMRNYIETVAKYGDNNRANMLIDYIGGGYQSSGFNYINSLLKSRGYTTTSVNRKIFIDANRVDEYAKPNVTSAIEIANIFTDLINNGYIGDKNYMKRICAYTDGKNEPYGVRKYLGDRFGVANHNASNTLTSNEVAFITSGTDEIVISVLATTRDKDSGDTYENRIKAINEIMGYIADNQFK